MNAETVGYRYTDDELTSLMLILSLDAPLGSSRRIIAEPAYDRAIEQLARSQIVTPAGDDMFIEPLTAMLLTELCSAQIALGIASQGRVTTIFRSPRLLIADELFSGIHTVTPLRDIPEASAHLHDSVLRHALPAEITLVTDSGAGRRSETAQDIDSLRRIAGGFLSQLNN